MNFFRIKLIFSLKIKLHFCLTKHHRRIGIGWKLYLQAFLTFALDWGSRATSQDDKTKPVLRMKLYETQSRCGCREEDKIPYILKSNPHHFLQLQRAKKSDAD